MRGRDLIQQVEDLFAPSDEIAGRQLRADRVAGTAERTTQALAPGPAVHRPDEAQFRFPASRQSQLGLVLGDVAPDPQGVGKRVANGCGRHPVAGRLVAAGLVDERRYHSGKLGGIERIPDAVAQALGDDQI